MDKRRKMDLMKTYILTFCRNEDFYSREEIRVKGEQSNNGFGHFNHKSVARNAERCRP